MQSSYNLMKFLGELVAGADHEISNLLMMVEGSAHILLSDKPSVEARSLAIGAISEKTKRIKEVMEELRTLLNDGSQDPWKDNYVKELTAQAISLCKTRFKNHKIFFSINIKEDSAIESRQTQMVQALLAVLTSAHDSIIQQKDRWIQVQVYDFDEEIVMEVSDSGHKFSPQDLEEGFSPFYTGAQGRLGVSLALAKHIVEGHGGQVNLFNKNDTTPTIRLSLPRSRPVQPAALAQPIIRQEYEIFEENVVVLQAKRAA